MAIFGQTLSQDILYGRWRLCLACITLHLLCTTPLLADKLLVLDSRVIERVENARLMPGSVSKHHGNPLFQADMPWENSLNNLYPNVIWDDEEKIFKMWYKCVLTDREAIGQMDRPSTVHDVGWYLLCAKSKVGLESPIMVQ
ncbi:MAG: hypothetical protein H7A55_02725 [Verrucomicrobiaceae bacterium]|nr:hypothetical protein [Verrucomicrobiaceae bacterium]